MKEILGKKAIAHVLLPLALSMNASAPAMAATGAVSATEVFQDLSQKPHTAKEQALIEVFAFLVNTNQLDGFLRGTINIVKYVPVVGGKVREVPPETLDAGLHIGAEAIRMLVQLQGEDKSYPEISYLNWLHSSRWMEKRLDSQEFVRTEKISNDISNARYYSELLSLAETKISKAQDFEILVDGPASFAKRKEIINRAEKSIDVLTWAILDDETGFEFRDQLISKHRQGVHIRVMVDGLVSQRRGYGQAVRDLAAAGIQVVRWKHKEIPFFGQHRKMMIVDGTYMIAGGLNAGNAYSHKAVEAKDKWRDTDIFATGDVVQQGNELFAKIWNEQVANPFPARQTLVTGGQISMSLVELKPDIRRQTGSTIMLSTLKAIRGAQHSIDIENAYVILFPQLEKELQNAVKRGVRVRVLTNSDSSVDEAIISQPMMLSAKRMAEMGVEVFFRQGSTLHSKFMVVDERVSMIGSYNLHPRSERIEGEMIFLINDENVAKEFTRVLENDLRSGIAKRVYAQDIAVEMNFLLKFTMRYFYDLL